MKEDKIYRTDVELYATAQLFGRDLYIYHRYGEHQVKWLKFPCSKKGLHKGRQSIYLDNRFGMGTGVHSIMCFVHNISNMAINVNNNVP